MDFTPSLLGELFPSASGEMFECTTEEAEQAMLRRFAVAGPPYATGRYIVAPRRISRHWMWHYRAMPANGSSACRDLQGLLVGKVYYGHLFCHVFHQDYLLTRGVDVGAFK